MQIAVYTVPIFHRDNLGKISRNTLHNYNHQLDFMDEISCLKHHHEDNTRVISPGIYNYTEI